VATLAGLTSQPRELARLWSGILGWELADDPHAGVAFLPRDDTGFRLRFLPSQQPKIVQNRMVLADSEGNEFCVLIPR
jgi:hypothetical protein